jgi:ligand-binding sensor domain-containing protein
VTSVWAVDPSRHISQYAHTAWRIQDGVFSGSPNAISQTTDGYLWIGTQAGLVRFDGARFVPWTPPDGQHLPSSNVTSLLGARDGSLWIGMEGGLSRWDKRDLTSYLIGPTRINSIIEDRNGTVWFVRSRGSAETGGLCQIIGTGMRCYGKADGLPGSNVATALVEDGLGNLWTGSDTAVVRWKPDTSTMYSPRGLKSNQGLDGVEGLAANPDGSLWVGMIFAGRGLGLQQLVQGAWKPFATPEFDGSTLEVQALFLDRENALWIGTLKQGIYRIHAGKVDHFRSADGLSSDTVYRFYEDHEGNLWLATSKGIDCFRDVRVATFSTREGLATSEVDAVFATQDGTVWIGGADALDAIHQDGMSSVQAGKGLPGNQVTSHRELLMLDFDLSERTISRWMKRAPRDPDPAKRWLAFLRNHREAIAAMDFFTVPTITFGVLCCFFVISHDRRRILHFNVTNHPRRGCGPCSSYGRRFHSSRRPGF